MRAELNQVETKLEARIAQVETSLETKIEQVETNLETKIAQVGTNLETKIAQVETNLEAKIEASQKTLTDLLKDMVTKQALRYELQLVEARRREQETKLKLTLANQAKKGFFFRGS